MTLGRSREDTKDEWQLSDREPVCCILSMRTNGSNYTIQIVGSTALFNHVGDGIVISHHTEHTLRVIDYPSLTVRESPAAHVGGCVALALDPRGRYLASGGLDSIINMFDLNDWICARTITICECVNMSLHLFSGSHLLSRNAVNGLSFSYDGEYLAIASAGTYIDIVCISLFEDISRR